MGFSRQENWSGLLFPSPRGLPDPGIEPKSLASPALADSTTTATLGSPSHFLDHYIYIPTKAYLMGLLKYSWLCSSMSIPVVFFAIPSYEKFCLWKYSALNFLSKWYSRWDLPGRPVIKTVLPMQGAGVWSLVRELRFHMPRSTTLHPTHKKKKRFGEFKTHCISSKHTVVTEKREKKIGNGKKKKKKIFS